jgi:hypothetical protein
LSNVSHPLALLNAAGSKKSVGLTAVTAEEAADPTIKSKMSLNGSAFADGAPANGDNPNAKNAPAEPPRPNARRRAFLADRFFFEER